MNTQWEVAHDLPSTRLIVESFPYPTWTDVIASDAPPPLDHLITHHLGTDTCAVISESQIWGSFF